MKQGVVCQEVSGSLVQASTLTEICALTCSLALNYCSDEVPPDSHIITLTQQWFLLYQDQDARYLAGSSQSSVVCPVGFLLFLFSTKLQQYRD